MMCGPRSAPMRMRGCPMWRGCWRKICCAIWASPASRRSSCVRLPSALLRPTRWRCRCGCPPSGACPQCPVAGDSHSPTVDALGVLGWGVGGIEIETVVLGQPYVFPKPEFVGVRLEGALPQGVTVTDLALTLTAQLRAAGVVG